MGGGHGAGAHGGGTPRPRELRGEARPRTGVCVCVNKDRARWGPGHWYVCTWTGSCAGEMGERARAVWWASRSTREKKKARRRRAGATERSRSVTHPRPRPGPKKNKKEKKHTLLFRAPHPPLPPTSHGPTPHPPRPHLPSQDGWPGLAGPPIALSRLGKPGRDRAQPVRERESGWGMPERGGGGWSSERERRLRWRPVRVHALPWPGVVSKAVPALVGIVGQRPGWIRAGGGANARRRPPPSKNQNAAARARLFPHDPPFSSRRPPTHAHAHAPRPSLCLPLAGPKPTSPCAPLTTPPRPWPTLPRARPPPCPPASARCPSTGPGGSSCTTSRRPCRRACGRKALMMATGRT